MVIICSNWKGAMKKMKKQIIIGAASLALATVPVAGTFAATTASDSVQITVSQTCDLSRSTGSGTYSATMGMNALNTNVGTSTFSVNCNAPKGYTVKVTTYNLVNRSSSSYTIPYYTGTGTGKTGVPAAGTAVWAITKGGSSATDYVLSGGTIMSTSAADTSSTATTQQVTYKASTTSLQAAGTYRRSANDSDKEAVYTLTANT